MFDTDRESINQVKEITIRIFNHDKIVYTRANICQGNIKVNKVGIEELLDKIQIGYQFSNLDLTYQFKGLCVLQLDDHNYKYEYRILSNNLILTSFNETSQLVKSRYLLNNKSLNHLIINIRDGISLELNGQIINLLGHPIERVLIYLDNLTKGVIVQRQFIFEEFDEKLLNVKT